MTTEDYYLPESPGEATRLLAKHGSALLIMAGGTIAMPLINEGVSAPERVMGLRRAGLNHVERSNGLVTIGAASTLSQMLRRTRFFFSGKRRTTLAGGRYETWDSWRQPLRTASRGRPCRGPAGIGRRGEVGDADGERVLPLTEFYAGFMTTALRAAELVTELLVPIPAGRTTYIKYGRRHANTPAIVTVAANLAFDGKKVKDVRIALNGVGPHPFRAGKAEETLLGSTLDTAAIAAAAGAAAEECEPFSDAIASEWYRRRAVEVYVRRALTQIAV